MKYLIDLVVGAAVAALAWGIFRLSGEPLLALLFLLACTGLFWWMLWRRRPND